MAKDLTRRELFDLVWGRPMTKVAADLGISDVALHKICDKHRIPAPGRGYWAKVAAGGKPPKGHFREISNSGLNLVRIYGSPLQALPEPVREARAKAMAMASAPPVVVEPTPTPDLHPAAERLKHFLAKGKPNAAGFIDISDAKTFPALVSPLGAERAASVLNALLATAIAAGYAVEAKDGRLVVDGEPITLQFSEKVDRIPHTPTDKELRAVASFEAEQERQRRRGGWVSDYGRPYIPEFDHVPNGLLILEIDKGSHWDGLRRKFTDGKRQRLETMVSGILTAAATIAAYRKEQREKARVARIEAEEREKVRRENERRMRLHTKRPEYLEKLVAAAEKARRLEGFVEAYLNRFPADELPEMALLWIDWTKGNIDSLYREIAPETVVATLKKYGLDDDATDISSWVRID